MSDESNGCGCALPVVVFLCALAAGLGCMAAWTIGRVLWWGP